MGEHIINGEFQSDKYPTTPRGKVPLSVADKTAQDLLWEYAQRRRAVDEEFAADLETCLLNAGMVDGFAPRTHAAIAVLDRLADWHDNQASEADAMDFAESSKWHDARRAEIRACIDALAAHLPSQAQKD